MQAMAPVVGDIDAQGYTLDAEHEDATWRHAEKNGRRYKAQGFGL